jgi:hypothetical protein
MALPTTFATLSGGNQPLALLDTQFSAVGALGSIPCAAAGQNTISLTPFTNTPTVVSYTDLAPSFVFAAAQTSNGSVQINAALLGARNAYKWNGQQLCGAGDIVAGMVYKATPLQALNGGAGGFALDTVGIIASPSGGVANASNQFEIEFIIDGGGVAITNGNKGQLHIPFNCSIFTWRAIADQSGSIAVDILRANLAVPTVSMVGAGNKPGLSSQQISLGAALTGWTSTVLAYDDWIAFNVTSVTLVTRVTIVLSCAKS